MPILAMLKKGGEEGMGLIQFNQKIDRIESLSENE
jgi:hypothetical protein